MSKFIDEMRAYGKFYEEELEDMEMAGDLMVRVAAVGASLLAASPGLLAAFAEYQLMSSSPITTAIGVVGGGSAAAAVLNGIDPTWDTLSGFF